MVALHTGSREFLPKPLMYLPATPRGKLILRAQINVDSSEPNAVEELMSLGGQTGATAPEVVINDLSYDVDFASKQTQPHMPFLLMVAAIMFASTPLKVCT